MQRLTTLGLAFLRWAGHRLSESTTEFLAYVVIIVALVVAAKLGVIGEFAEWLNNSGGGGGGGASP